MREGERSDPWFLTQELTSSLPTHPLVKKETYSSLLVDQLNFSPKFKLE